MKNPRVLIVSNNALSMTNNNGKTLESLFSNFNTPQISQLYFSSETPNSSVCNNFFRITDKQVVKSVFNKKHYAGEKVSKAIETNKDLKKKKQTNPNSKFKKSQIIRLIREVFWVIGNWDSEKLISWLDDLSPEIIFFCAGDSVFAYKVVDFILNKYDSKLVVYITDDYILPRKSLNLSWWIRRNIILANIKKATKKSSLFLTISDKMRIIYQEFIGVDSIVAVNMTASMKDEKSTDINDEEIRFVYTGGLHFNRYKTLVMLAESIQNYNNNHTGNKKAILRIYSNEKPNNRILGKINIEGASEFCGSLDPVNLKKILNECSVPVHVESFDKKSIESTKLSISTKIPEYLSLEKPILAIGPREVASMEYLSDAAYCITNQFDIDKGINEFIGNEDLKKQLSISAASKYSQNHNRFELGKQLKYEIEKII